MFRLQLDPLRILVWCPENDYLLHFRDRRINNHVGDWQPSWVSEFSQKEKCGILCDIIDKWQKEEGERGGGLCFAFMMKVASSFETRPPRFTSHRTNGAFQEKVSASVLDDVFERGMKVSAVTDQYF
jgi:hypothetical protein